MRAEDDSDILERLKVFGLMPRGAIHNHYNSIVFVEQRKLSQIESHHFRICTGQDQRKRIAVRRTNSAVNVGILSDSLHGHDRAKSCWRPTTRRITHTAKACLVLKKHFQRACVFLRKGSNGGCHNLWKFFLNSSCVSESLLGWRGLGSIFLHPWR